MQVPSRCAYYVRTAASGNNDVSAVFPHFWPQNSPNLPAAMHTFAALGATGNGTRMTLFGYYAAMFMGHKGSMRYKLLTTVAADSGENFETVIPIHAYSETYPAVSGATIRQYISADGGVSNTFMDVQATGPENGVEVAFPYYGPKKYQLVREVPALTNNNNPALRLDYFNYVVDSVYLANVFVSAGSDYSCVRFRRLPLLILNSTG